MAKLIEASGLLEQVVRIQASEQAPEKKVGQIIMAITDAPTVDAAPVVYGRWEPHPKANGFERCSVCHDCIIYDDWAEEPKWYYCPNCGAKMDGGDGR